MAKVTNCGRTKPGVLIPSTYSNHCMSLRALGPVVLLSVPFSERDVRTRVALSQRYDLGASGCKLEQPKDHSKLHQLPMAPTEAILTSSDYWSAGVLRPYSLSSATSSILPMPRFHASLSPSRDIPTLKEFWDRQICWLYGHFIPLD